MRTVSKRELNQHTAQVLAGVDSGEPVAVTEHGVARWRIEAIGAPADPVERLRLAGRITGPRSSPAPWPTGDEGVRYTPEQIDALYAEQRGDH